MAGNLVSAKGSGYAQREGGKQEFCCLHSEHGHGVLYGYRLRFSPAQVETGTVRKAPSVLSYHGFLTVKRVLFATPASRISPLVQHGSSRNPNEAVLRVGVSVGAAG